jgi:hypothetical protein
MGSDNKLAGRMDGNEGLPFVDMVDAEVEIRSSHQHAHTPFFVLASKK